MALCITITPTVESVIGALALNDMILKVMSVLEHMRGGELEPLDIGDDYFTAPFALVPFTRRKSKSNPNPQREYKMVFTADKIREAHQDALHMFDKSVERKVELLDSVGDIEEDRALSWALEHVSRGRRDAARCSRTRPAPGATPRLCPGASRGRPPKNHHTITPSHHRSERSCTGADRALSGAPRWVRHTDRGSECVPSPCPHSPHGWGLQHAHTHTRRACGTTSTCWLGETSPRLAHVLWRSTVNMRHWSRRSRGAKHSAGPAPLDESGPHDTQACTADSGLG
jgi:hypothetical protein